MKANIYALGASLLLASPSFGISIIIDGTASWNTFNDGVPGDNPVGNFDASGSDKLVVIVTGEHGNPGSTAGNAFNVTYDGVGLTRVIDRNPPNSGDQLYHDIWYLDNPITSTGLIVADVDTRGNVTVFGLSNTNPGVGNTVIGAPNSSSADLTTMDDSIVIASYGMGGNGNTAVLSQVTTPAPLIEVSRQENGSNWDGHVVAYQNNVAAGSATYSFTDASTTGAHVIAAEFTAVPEPSSTTLLGLGGIALLLRRRK